MTVIVLILILFEEDHIFEVDATVFLGFGFDAVEILGRGLWLFGYLGHEGVVFLEVVICH